MSPWNRESLFAACILLLLTETKPYFHVWLWVDKTRSRLCVLFGFRPLISCCQQIQRTSITHSARSSRDWDCEQFHFYVSEENTKIQAGFERRSRYWLLSSARLQTARRWIWPRASDREGALIFTWGNPDHSFGPLRHLSSANPVAQLPRPRAMVMDKLTHPLRKPRFVLIRNIGDRDTN